MGADEHGRNFDGVIGLWGARSVGKTSLLSAAFLGSNELKERIDSARSPDLGRLFGDYYNWLTQSHTQPTARTEADFTFTTTSGRSFRVRDVSGGATISDSAQEIAARLADVDILLLLLDSSGLNLPDQFASILRAELGFQGPPLRIGLVCTKCEEKWLMKGADGWRAERGWWREAVQTIAGVGQYAKRLAEFEDRVWPVSAFGFDEFGRPSVILDEFGNRVPFNVSKESSIGVARPFLWALDQLESKS
jgi:hypothetical protein